MVGKNGGLGEELTYTVWGPMIDCLSDTNFPLCIKIGYFFKCAILFMNLQLFEIFTKPTIGWFGTKINGFFFKIHAQNILRSKLLYIGPNTVQFWDWSLF